MGVSIRGRTNPIVICLEAYVEESFRLGGCGMGLTLAKLFESLKWFESRRFSFLLNSDGLYSSNKIIYLFTFILTILHFD